MPDLDLGLDLQLDIPEGNPYSGTYVWKLEDCTGLDDLAVKQATGYTLVSLANNALNVDVGLGVVFAAVIVWLHRKKNGFPHTTFEDVASKLPWSAKPQLSGYDPTGDPSGKAESEASSPTSDSPAGSPTSTPSDPGNLTGSPTENATT